MMRRSFSREGVLSARARRLRVLVGMACVGVSSQLVLAGALPSRARAVSMVAGATEITQVSNNIVLIQDIINTINQGVTLAKQLKIAADNIKKLSNGESLLSMFGEFQNIYGGTQRVLFAGKSLAQRWRETHPGRKDPSKLTPDGQYPKSIHQADVEAYDQIDRNLQEAAEKQFAILDVQAGKNAYETDKQIYESLKQRVGTEEGALQAVQLSNQFLLEVVRELRMLRRVQEAHANLMGEYVSAEAQRRQYDAASRERDPGYTGRYRPRRYLDWDKKL